MNSLNSILLEGNLVRDPEAGETPKGTQFCKFSIATNRYYKQEDVKVDEVSYFDVEVWSKLAENCQNNLEKGRGVRVVGRLKQDRWQDDEGKGRTKIKIVGEHVEFKPQFKKQEESESVAVTNDSREKEPVF